MLDNNENGNQATSNGFLDSWHTFFDQNDYERSRQHAYLVEYAQKLQRSIRFHHHHHHHTEHIYIYIYLWIEQIECVCVLWTRFGEISRSFASSDMVVNILLGSMKNKTIWHPNNTRKILLFQERWTINVHEKKKKYWNKCTCFLLECLLGVVVAQNANNMRSIKNGFERQLLGPTKKKKNTHIHHPDRQNGTNK